MFPKCICNYMYKCLDYNTIIVYFTVPKPGTLYLAWHSPRTISIHSKCTQQILIKIYTLTSFFRNSIRLPAIFPHFRVHEAYDIRSYGSLKYSRKLDILF